MAGQSMKLEFILSARPGRVMDLLTDAALIRRWSGGEAIVENKQGGAFTMFDGWVTGAVMKISENELAYTWTTTDWPEGTPASEVHYLLVPDAAGTKVTVTHNNLPDEDEMKAHKAGWTDYFFDPLEDYISIFEKS